MIPKFGINLPALHGEGISKRIAHVGLFALRNNLAGMVRVDISFPRVFRSPRARMPDYVRDALIECAVISDTIVLVANPGPDGGEGWAWRKLWSQDYGDEKPIYVLDPNHRPYIEAQLAEYFSFCAMHFNKVYVQPAHERNGEDGTWLPCQDWASMVEGVCKATGVECTSVGFEHQNASTLGVELKTAPETGHSTRTTSWYLDQTQLGQKGKAGIPEMVRKKALQYRFDEPTIIVETGIHSDIFDKDMARVLLMEIGKLPNVVGVCLYGTDPNRWELPVE